MSTIISRKAIYPIMGVAGLVLAAPTSAETTKSGEPQEGGALKGSMIEEVIVTARRREEALQNVPMSISVLDSRALVEEGITTPNDLLTVVAGLTGGSGLTTGQRPTPIYSIRGQGEAVPGSAPGVVSYLAEVPDFSPFLYDLQNVQVLKGPQGTLFGRNTTGGAILFTPHKPTDEFSGYINSRFGDYSNQDVDFGVTVPLVGERLSMRLAGQRLRRDGYVVDRVTGQDFNDVHRESLRASLLAKPTESVENLLIVQVDDIFENGPTTVFEQSAPGNPTLSNLPLRDSYLEEQQRRGPFSIESDLDSFMDYHAKGVINQTTWDVTNAWRIKNIVSFKKAETSVAADYDGSSFLILHGLSPKHINSPRKYTTEELQVQYDHKQFRGILGVYYEETKQDDVFREVDQGVTGSTPAFPIYLHVSFEGLSQTQLDRSKAVFAQGTVTDLWLEGLNLTVGARYTKDTRATHGEGVAIPVIGPTGAEQPGFPVTPAVSPRLHSSEATWTGSLDYQWMDNVMVYGSVRTGYKAGGFNVPTNNNVQLTYDPEFVVSKELGIKSQWLLGGMPLRANATVFHDAYDDIQRFVAVPGIPLGSNAITNAAKATVMGLDLELDATPVSWFNLALNYAFLNTDYQDYEDVVFGNLKDSEFPNAPRHQISVKPSVRFEAADLGKFSVSATWYWQSKTYFTIPNKLNGVAANDIAVPGSVGPSYHRLGLRADWREIMGSGFSVGAFVENATDETYRVGSINYLANDLTGFASYYYGPPRMYGMELSYSF